MRHRDNSGSENEWSQWTERTFNTMRRLITLVPQGAVWNYRDNSQNLGTLWRNTNYSDALWASGRAQFGFGDGDELTTTCCSSGTRPMTTYFHRRS